MFDSVEWLEDNLGARFIRVSGGKQVWEVDNMVEANLALRKIEGSSPYNWCATQQPNGPSDHRKPQIII